MIKRMREWLRDFQKSDQGSLPRNVYSYQLESILGKYNHLSFSMALSTFYFQGKNQTSLSVYSCEQSKLLLENYVFKVVPLLNPDGVSRGYFRLDTYNHNLNRFYLNPDPKWQPTIYAAKEALVQ